MAQFFERLVSQFISTWLPSEKGVVRAEFANRWESLSDVESSSVLNDCKYRIMLKENKTTAQSDRDFLSFKTHSFCSH